MSKGWGSLSRPFNDPAAFERDKGARIRPPFQTLVIYTLRIQWPEILEADVFGQEFAVSISDITDHGAALELGIVWQPKDEPTAVELPFNHDGFLITGTDEERDVYDGGPSEVMGYFVGSQDPWDIAMEEMKERLYRAGSPAMTVSVSEGGVLIPH